MVSASYEIKGKKSKKMLSLGQKFSYGVGHVLNDLCASMWFTYMLIFFTKVLQFSSSLAGALMLIGQVADGVATPFVGYFSDRGDDFWICKYGKRKTWHLLGTICVICSFPFIFTPCIGCSQSDDWAQMIYFSAFIVIFQFGWAAVQISHLSLVPDLTPDEHQRTSLLAIRNSFTVISTIVIYVILWIVMEAGGKDPNAQISPADVTRFQILVYTMVPMGTVMSLVFHIGTKETIHESLLPRDELQSASSQQTVTGSSTLGLFTQFKIYQVAVLYMATRLFANISQTIFPIYIHDNLHLGGQSIAILPLVMYALSFVMSVFIKPLNKRFGRKIAYCFGSICGIGVSIWVRLATGDLYDTYLIYVVAGLYGISSSAILVTSLGITADLIGQDLNNGAFIYGLMSLTDKVSNGVVVMVIQSLNCSDCQNCPTHYRDSLAFVCGLSALLGSVAVLSLGEMTKEEKHSTNDDEPATSGEVAVNT